MLRHAKVRIGETTPISIACGASVLVILALVVLVSSGAGAETVNYVLDNVIMDRGGQQMSGAFSWTYDDPEEFENGVGVFSFLDIPFTAHDHTDLETEVDVGSSVEITFPGNFHDEGVDITLFLDGALTPTAGAPVDLGRSQHEIGGNALRGAFISGSISLVVVDTPGDTDGDHDVDDTDYGNFVAQFGGPPAADSADFNNDGTVDLADFSIQRANFGVGVPPPAPGFAATIPEPATTALLAAILPLILRRRRSRLRGR